jgi:hypothetical protein
MPPAFEPTDDQRRTVEKLSGLGLPQGDIAQVVGVDEKTLRKHLRAELDPPRPTVKSRSFCSMRRRGNAAKAAQRLRRRSSGQRPECAGKK